MRPGTGPQGFTLAKETGGDIKNSKMRESVINTNLEEKLKHYECQSYT